MEETSLVPAPQPESAGQIVTDYFAKIRRILGQPRAFFASLPLSSPIGGPLAFALITHWIAAGLDFLITRGLGMGTLSDAIMRLNLGDDIDTPARSEVLTRMKAQLADWLSSSALVITAPFWTLAWLLFSAFWIWVASRLLAKQPAGSPRATYGSAVRLLCFATTPVLFSCVPGVGGLIVAVYSVILTVIGAREIYQVSTERAVVIALFPRILAMVAIMGTLFLLLALAAGFFFRMVS